MRESKKLLGILLLFLAVALTTGIARPENFLQPYNLENLMKRTALYGILSVGVVFPILTGGIDLSIGSIVGLVGTVLPWLLVQYGWGVAPALLFVLAISAALGLAHGLLITRLRLQPFVVTLCGLLLYRGIARWLTDDQTQGFGSKHDTLRLLATGKPFPMSAFLAGAGVVVLILAARLYLSRRRAGEPLTAVWAWGAGGALALLAAGGLLVAGPDGLGALRVPAPFLVLLVQGVVAHVVLTRTVFGRYLFAVGRNEEAARYAGVDTDRVIVLSYVLCAGCAGLGAVLFALDVNSVQPAAHGNFYELYAIAAAVLGGCSLRGGEGSIAGVVIGAALLRVLYNAINLLSIPTTLEFAIIGAVLLLGVSADEVVRRFLRRAG